MKEPEKKLLPATYNAKLGAAEAPEAFQPEGATATPLEINQLMTPQDYDRDIRHYGRVHTVFHGMIRPTVSDSQTQYRIISRQHLGLRFLSLSYEKQKGMS